MAWLLYCLTSFPSTSTVTSPPAVDWILIPPALVEPEFAVPATPMLLSLMVPFINAVALREFVAMAAPSDPLMVLFETLKFEVPFACNKMRLPLAAWLGWALPPVLSKVLPRAAVPPPIVRFKVPPLLGSALIQSARAPLMSEL